ncbi:hypothetical protein [Streptomyces sp. NPDC093544]|uniref:hypothetical protein n=1 Tax=Streptomyces sp. NPDC093544 TaxID=3155200 RepID=UPI00342732F2
MTRRAVFSSGGLLTAQRTPWRRARAERGGHHGPLPHIEPATTEVADQHYSQQYRTDLITGGSTSSTHSA